ncbi:DUF1553 domain-containing protein [Limnoglobus roseus]|uniref:DUF1553 domain-containing protein n=1 Tax=Limnoglobus roseus TaxID=2598579 RepID=A0A5C1A6V6_9BACT|nr:DUF1553 domain-containing protein [Limnoglobus roseus]QEL14989.1 hypothetical protein PX52LOC_01894 [Limnoglobus roseus]
MRRLFATVSTLLATALVGSAAPPDPQALADRIDARLDARLAAEKAKAAPPADDAEFLRRAYLDVTGRIPSPHDVYDFLADKDANKRAKLIDALLETPRHAGHFAAIWRATLVPEVAAVPEARVFRSGFEAWLRQKFRANTRYDVLVRELLTADISPDADAPTPALRRPDDPNPLAFYAVKEAKAENLAATTSRVFLGVQIECAQCHDHPFAKWTRDQFWNTAAFFAGVERHGDTLFGQLSETIARREIVPVVGKQAVAALFLDDKVPAWGKAVSPRVPLAAWVTAKDNPFFAKAAVNRVWGQFFGRGLVDPVDDFRDDNPPSHPELLDDLAKAFADSGFDLQFLMKAIGRTKAYHRTSARTDATQDDPRLYARMAVKGLTGEQLFDSFVRATGFREGVGRNSPRDQFLTRFAPTGKEPETSIPQALTLMNGKFIADATTLDSSPTLTAACETPGLEMAERVEVLYAAALSRLPTEKERERMLKYVSDGGTGKMAERLGDVFWVLLNSAEFRLNH